jgi:hypothetical protein
MKCRTDFTFMYAEEFHMFTQRKIFIIDATYILRSRKFGSPASHENRDRVLDQLIRIVK